MTRLISRALDMPLDRESARLIAIGFALIVGSVVAGIAWGL